MKTIGITGQNGFIGSYLFNKLSLLKDEFKLISFDRKYFNNQISLEAWVKECDVIVHLAALNRDPNPQVIHDTNVDLVKKLMSALDKVQHKLHVIFSSSTQEERDNLYGQSKKSGRESLIDWAKKSEAVFTGLIIPNVYGPFGKPFYNSVIATFCHQLVNDQNPEIDNDGLLNLIYVDELAETIITAIRDEKNDVEFKVEATCQKYVSEILTKLKEFKSLYFDQGIFPDLPDNFSRNLFNTFRSYIDHQTYFPRKLKSYPDQRGVFVEMVKLAQGGQVSFSTTVPGITRGNHFHTRKIERFIVIKGQAIIQLRKFGTEEVINLELNGDQPSYVDMSIWYTHNIKNIGASELYTVFWINEFFDPADPDTFFEVV